MIIPTNGDYLLAPIGVWFSKGSVNERKQKSCPQNRDRMIF